MTMTKSSPLLFRFFRRVHVFNTYLSIFRIKNLEFLWLGKSHFWRKQTQFYILRTCFLFFSHICMSRGATSNSRRRDRCHSYIVVTAMYFELIDCYEPAPAPAPASFPLCVIVKMCFTKLSTNNFSKKKEG